ncbi:MAG: formylglycine-generating enzyme family protein [Desulfobacca sp.]|nr:formylglycine-generating enzyme family protein [Desulfobacca sp.]
MGEVPALGPSAIQIPAGLETLTNSLNMTFVRIPAGSFLMGSPETETGRSSDETQHEVTISQDLYFQVTPVTQGQWQALMGHIPSRMLKTGADLPVEGVNWNDCQEFIRKLLALQEGIYRLPTEAEWEYACRAGSPTALANGDLITLFCELDPALDEIGWYCGNSNRSLQPVAQKRPNAWGLYDMHGNVAEWCQDWYSSYPETAQTDPAGPLSGPGRVVRGGSWFSSAKKCRCAARFYAPPHSRNRFPISGFRLVRVV